MSADPRQHHRPKWLPALCLSLVLAAPVHAQLLGGAAPQVRVPAVTPLAGQVLDRVADTPRELRSRVSDPLLRRLLRRHPDLVALDPHGAAIVRNEVLAIDPDDEMLALARANGFETGALHELDGLGLRIAVLRAPAGMDTAAALARLRELDPRGSYDFNHLYSGSTATISSGGATSQAESRATAPALRIGLIDSGVSRGHPALRGTEIHAWGCDGKQVPGKHGTAIASLLAATTLYSADIYCGAPTGGSATAFAAALGWMARPDVAVR